MSLTDQALQQATPLLEEATRLLEQKAYKKAYPLFQQAAEHFEEGGAFSKALTCAQQALSIKLQLIEEGETIELVNSYLVIGNCYIFLSDFSKSTFNLKTALKMLLDRGDTHTAYTAECYDLLATVYNTQRRVGEAIAQSQKSLNITLHLYGETSLEASAGYNSLGTNLFTQGNYEKAKMYFEKALPIALKTVGKKDELTCFIYLNIGCCLINLERPKEAINYLLPALKAFLPIVGDDSPHLYFFYLHTANAYIKIKEYDTALSYQQKLLALVLKNYGKQHHAAAEVYSSIGECLANQEQYLQAILHFKEVYSINNQSYQEAHFLEHPPIDYYLEAFTLHSTLRYEAEAYFNYYQSESSNIQHLHYALNNCRIAILLIHQKRSQSLNKDSKTQSAANTFPAAEMGIKTAVAAAKVAKTQALPFKKASEEVAQINTLRYPAEKFSYAKNEQDCLAAAFEFCEQVKSMLLLGNLKEGAAKAAAHIPTELLEQELNLRKTRTDLTKRIKQEEFKPLEEQDKIQIRNWQNEHFDQEEEYQQLIRQLEANYPNYFHLKHQVEPVSVEALQKNIPPQTALIEYFIGDKQKELFYIFVITSNEIQVLEVPFPDDLEELIEAFKALIDEMDKSEYLELAFELYELLIAPITKCESPITSHPSPITNLKIIPAGILNTIPFEALLTEEVATNSKYADLPYLLLQYDISYHYSATLWHQALQNIDEKQMEASFVGFAPVYKNEQKQSLDESITSRLYNEESTRSVRIGAETYSELIHSEEEVNSVQSYFNAKNIPTQTYLHTEANTDNFLQNIGKHKYVLISAHGFYNEKQPDLTGIILSPTIAKNPEQSGQASPTPERFGDVWSGQMSPNHKGVGESSVFYLSDAYNLELNADLVVLSCCETGLGKLAIGEGVMALNRGFFYAGAKNVIYTLFKVYDQASCQLTKHLFQHILAEKRYPSALKEAKRQMILEGKAPIHWAGYLLIGE